MALFYLLYKTGTENLLLPNSFNMDYLSSAGTKIFLKEFNRHG